MKARHKFESASRLWTAAVVLAASIVALVASPPTPAKAVAVTCGTSSTPTVVALADPSFYIDTGIDPRLTATYGGYTVRAGLTSEPDLRIVLSNFTGGVVSLAASQPSDVTLPSLSAGEAKTAYFLFTASAATVTPQTHTITLYRGGTYLCERTFTYARVAETIKALANKVDSVTASTADAAKVGDALVVTVEGRTGTLGAGPTYDTGVLSYAPNALSSFPANAWRLEQTIMTISPDGTSAANVYTDRLFLSGASGPDRPYTAKYTFRAIDSTNQTTKVQPVQYIASGTQVKHTDISGSVDGTIPPISDTSNLSMTKSVEAVSPAFTVNTQTFPPLGSSAKGGTVKYTVTISNTGGSTGTLDKVVDTMDTGITYVDGSASVASRSKTPGVSGQVLTFYGPISIPAGGSIKIVYNAVVRDVAGSYSNSAVGWYGNFKVDGVKTVNGSSPAKTTVTVAQGGTVSAVNDSASATSGVKKTIAVLENDVGNNLSISAITQPSNGISAISGTSIDYTSDAGFGGTDRFTYTITNGSVTSTATVTVTIPLGVYDEYLFGVSNPNNLNQTVADPGLLGNDTCPNSPCELTSITPSKGTMTRSGTNRGGFTVTLANNLVNSTPITFTYAFKDAAGNTATGSGRVITSFFGPDKAGLAYKATVTINVSANDTCGRNGCNSVQVPGTQPETVDGVAVPNAADGTKVDYTGNAGFVGMDNFQYKQGNDIGDVHVLVAPPVGTVQTTIDKPINETNNPGFATIGNTTWITKFGGTISSPYPKYDCSGCVFSVSVAPQYGAVRFVNTSTGQYTYTPNAGATGTDSFKYNLTDTMGLVVEGTVNFQIGPDAVDDSGLSVFANDTLSFNVLTNDKCPASATCSIAIDSNVMSGTLTQTVANGGAFTYVNTSAIGTYTFTYRITSSITGTIFDTATVTISVEGAKNDSATTSPGQPVTIPIRSNDPCIDCSTGTVNTPVIGTRTINTNGSVTYIPPSTFSGVVKFDYTVTKGGKTTSATITVTVKPDAIDDTVAVLPNSSNNQIDVLRNDVCGDCIITVKTNPAAGSLSIASDKLGLVYTAPAGGGPYTFTYTIQESSTLETDTATVTVTIASAPTAVNDASVIFAGQAVSINTHSNDTCTNGPCTVEVASDPSHGTVSLSVSGIWDVVYFPAPGFTGVDSFNYMYTNSFGLSATAKVTVTVKPIARNDRKVTGVNVPVAIDVRANDDCFTCTVSVIGSPSGGTIVSIVGDIVTFKSATPGTFTFDYSVTDTTITGLGQLSPSDSNLSLLATDPATATATAEIVVGDATPDEASTPYYTAVTVDVIANDTCLSAGCTLDSVDASGAPANDSASVVLVGGVNKVRYQPALNFEGLVTFTYTAKYGSNSAVGTVTVLVGRKPLAYTIDKNAVTSGNVLTGIPCDTCTVSLVSYSGNGDIILDSTGAYTYTPKLDYLGPDPGAITYKITDSASLLSPQNSQNSTLNFTMKTLTPSVLITKSGSLTMSNGVRPTAGDIVDYSYLVTNTYGDGDPGVSGYDLTNITVTDDKIDNDATNIKCSGSSDNVIASLAKGASVTCTAKYALTQADIDSGKITNIATASGFGSPSGGTGSTPAIDTDTITIGLTRLAKTSVTKSAGPVNRSASDLTKDKAGDTITYSYAVKNTGNVTLTNVTVVDDKIVDNAATLKCPAGGTNNVIASLAPGVTVTCSAVYTLTADDITAKSVSNTATVTGTAPSGMSDPLPSTSGITVPLNEPISLSLTKTAGSVVDADSNGTDPGDTITYSFTVKNESSSATLTNIELVDGKITSGLKCTGQTNAIIPSLAPGVPTTCSGTYTLTQSDIDSGAVINSATVSSNYTMTSGAIITVFASATNTKTLTQSPAVSITNTASSMSNSVVAPGTQTDAGDKANFSYVVTNTGNVTLTNVIVSGTATTTVDCGSGSATIASLAPGATKTCTAAHVVTQTHLTNGTISNTGTAASSFTAYGAGSPTNVTASANASTSLVQVPNVKVTNSGTIVKGSDNRSDAGDNVVFTYTISNPGNVILVSVSASSSSGTVDCDPGPGTSTTVGPLAPGESAQCTVTRALTQAQINAGSTSDTATVTSSYTKADASVVSLSDSAPATVAIDQSASISLTDRFSAFSDGIVAPTGRVDAGDEARFLYEVTNTGNITLSTITLTSSSGVVDCDVAPGNNATVSSLAPGDKYTCTATATVTNAQVDAGKVIDNARAESTVTYAVGGSTTVSATDSATENITAVPSVDITTAATIQHPSSPNQPGDLITYTYTVTNNGNTTLNSIAVTVTNQPTDALDNTIAAGSINCAATGSNVIATLAPGASTTCSATYAISQGEIEAGVVRNHVSASTTGASDTYEHSQDIIQDARVTITNTAEPLVDYKTVTPVPGDPVIYHIVVTNSGNVVLTGIVVTMTGDLTVDCGSSSATIESLEPGESVNCESGQYLLTQDDIDSSFVVNTANATTDYTYYGPRGKVDVLDSDADTTYLAEASIKIEKSADLNKGSNNRVDAGDTITYTFTVTNTGDITLRAIEVTDLKIIKSSIACDVGAGNKIGELASSAVATCQATYTILQADVDAGVITNTASARTGMVTDTATVTTMLSQSPSLRIVNSFVDFSDALIAPDTQTDAGDEANFSYAVTNTGNVTLANVAVSGTATTTVDCGSGSATITSLAPGQTVTCTAAHSVTQSHISNATISNTGTATSSFTVRGASSANSVTDSSIASSAIAQVPAVTVDNVGAIDKGLNGRSDATDNVVFTYTVTNTGNVSLSSVSVSSSSGTVDCVPGIGTSTTVGTLTPGATGECTVTRTLTQSEIDAGLATDTASVSSTVTKADATQSTVTDSDTASVTVDQSALMTITDDWSAFSDALVNPAGRVDHGDQATFAYVVTNTGNVTLTSVAVSSSSGIVDCDPVTSGNNATIASIAPGAHVDCTATATVTLAQIDAGVITDTGQADSTFVYADTGSTPLSVNDSDSKAITADPKLTVASTSSISPPAGSHLPGDLVTYTYTVTNTGNVTLANIAVTVENKAGDSTDNTIAPSSIECGAGGTNVITSLTPGNHVDCTAVYGVTQDDIDRGHVNNHVTAAATGTSATDTADRDQPINQHAELTVANTARDRQDNGTAGADTSDTITYDVRVTNTGNVTLSNIAVTMTNSLTLDCDPIASLAPGAHVDCVSSQYYLTDSDILTGNVVNTARAETTFTYAAGGPPATVSDSDPATTYLAPASVEIVKSAVVNSGGDSRVDKNDTVTYTLTVHNTGGVTLLNVVVADPKVGNDAILCSGYAGNTIGTLAANQTVACEATYTITQADIDSGSISNTATATSGSVTDTDTLVTTLEQNPALSVDKTGVLDDTVVSPSGSTDAGDTIAYRYALTNTGNVTLTALTVTDDKIPTATDIKCPVGSGTNNVVASLAPGVTVTCGVTYSVTSGDIAAGSVTNVANVAAKDPGGADITPATDTLTVNVPHASVTISKTGVASDGGDGRIDAGDSVSYTFTVHNTGGVVLTNIEVADPKIGGSPIVCEGQEANIIETLAIDATKVCSAIYEITQDDIDAGSISNTATVTSAVASDSDTFVTVLGQSPGLSVAKTGILDDTIVNPNDSTEAGDTIAYRYALTNTGNVTLTDLTVTDDKIAVATDIKCPVGSGTNNVVASLAPGAIVTCGVTYTVTSSDVTAGSVTNVATVGAKGPDGLDITPATDTLTKRLSPPTQNISSVRANDDSMSAPMGAILEIDVLENDTGSNLRLVDVTQPGDGRTEIKNGLVLLTPSLMYTGQLTFNYSMTDGRSTSRANVVVKFTENLLKPDPELFLDINVNGKRDPKEPGVKGVKMNLALESRAVMRMSDGGKGVGAAAVRATTMRISGVSPLAAPVQLFNCATVDSGFCSSTKLPIGNYLVKADFAPSKFGLITTADTDGSLDLQARSVPQGNGMSEVRFGVAGIGSVGGRTFSDKDNNRQFDQGRDRVLPNMPITIVWAGIDGKLGTDDDVMLNTTTDSNGKYLVHNLPVGSYTVEVAGKSQGVSLAEVVDTNLTNNKRTTVDFRHVPRTPATGSNSRNAAEWAMSLIALGALLLVSSRRRRIS